MNKILFLILFLTSQIFGETYYISNAGNDSNDGQSASTAWRTLDKLHLSWGLINDGDSILLNRGDTFAPNNIDGRTGVIQPPLAKSGTENNHIVFSAYGTGEKPIISNENVSDYSEVIRGYSLAYYTFEYISFTGLLNFRQHDNPQGSHNVRFLYCDFIEARLTFTAPIQHDISLIFPCHSIEVGWCYFNYNGFGSEDLMNFGKISPGPQDGTPNVWIHHNTIYKAYEEAIDIGGGTGNVVEYNLISGTTTNGIKMHSQHSRLDSFTVRGNVILHVGMGYNFNDSPNQMANGNALAFISAGQGEVYNNVLSSRYSLAITEADQSEPTYGRMEEVNIYNNIIQGVIQISYLKSGTDVHGDTFGSNYYGDEPPLIARGIVFRNNIYSGHPIDAGKLARFWQVPVGGGSQIVNDPWTVTTGNWQTAWEERFGYDSNDEIQDDPDFVNETWTDFYNYGDWSLQSSSPAIDAGANPSTISGDSYVVDISGNAVPQGSGYDIGAYEYGSGYSPGLLLASPSSWSAGTIDASDTTFTYLYISNSGDTTVTYSIGFNDSTDFRIIGSGTTVSTETDTFKIVFDPTGNGTHTDSVTITHDGTNGTVIIPLIGTASTVTPASLSTSFTDNIGTLVFGSELIPNNDYTNSANWADDDPIGAVVNESGANEITESSGALFTSDGTWIELMYQDLCASGLMYKYEDVISNYVSGAIKLDHGQGAVPSDIVMNSADTYKGLFIADKNNYSTARNTGGCELTLASKSLKLVTSQYEDTVSVSNTGDADLTGTATLKNGTHFSILSGGTIFNSTDVVVRYKPTGEGSHTDSIFIATNGGNDTLALSGSWGVTTNPNFSLSKESYDFGNVDTATTVTDSVEVSNSGTGTLTGTATASGTGFSIVSGGTISIGAGGSAWVVYSFSPTSTGAYSGSVEFSTNATNQPTFSYPLSGVGQAVLTPPEFSINVSSYDFGTVDTSTAVIRAFQITDLGDTSLVGTMSLTDSTNFEIVSGSSYDTDSTHNFYIKYSPTTVTSHTCYVIFAHNASTSPDTLTLTGQGGEPYLVLSPTGSVDFGSVYTTQYADLSFTLENTGTGTLTGSLALGDSTDFSIQSGSVGNSSTIVIRFDPSTSGAKSTTFYLYHNASNYASPIEVSLFGTGTRASVQTSSGTKVYIRTLYIGN